MRRRQDLAGMVSYLLDDLELVVDERVVEELVVLHAPHIPGGHRHLKTAET